MTDGLGKRKFHRLPCPLDVRVDIVTAQDMPRGLPPLHLQGRNISKDGICLETKTLEVNGVSLLAGAPCARENRLRMTMTLTTQEPSLMVIGEVRWYDIFREEGICIYQLGIKFLNFEQKEGKARLLLFLKNYQPKGIIQKLFG